MISRDGVGDPSREEKSEKAATAFEAESSAMHGDCGFWHDHARNARMLNRPDAQML